MLVSEPRAGRTPLHEMAIRGEAPTVLLMATETDSEWTGSSARSGGGGSGDSFTSSSASEGTKTGDRGVGSSDDASSGRGKDSGRPARPVSPSSSTTAASLNMVVDADVGSGSAVNASPAAGVPGEEAGVSAPTSSLVRSPLPLSSFAPPSLADTEELRDHRRRQSGDAAAAGGGDEEPLGGGAAKGGDGSAALAINVSSSGRRTSRRASAARSRGGRATSVVQLESGKGGRRSGEMSIAEEEPASLRNAGSAGEADDDSARLGGSEATDEGSGWGGLLDVNVRCGVSGNCPIHEAAASGSVGAVLSLLDLGADMSIVNGCGDTALHVSFVGNGKGLRTVCCSGCFCLSLDSFSALTSRIQPVERADSDRSVVGQNGGTRTRPPNQIYREASKMHRTVCTS